METSSSPQQKINPLILVVIACICLVGLGGIAYYVGRAASPSKIIEQISPSPLPDRIIEMTPTSQEIVGWETYTGPSYTFMHPAGLPSDTNGAGTEYDSIRYRYMGPKQRASGRTQTSLFDGYSFMIIHLGPSAEQDYTTWAKARHDTSRETCIPDAKISELTPVTVGGEPALQYSAVGCMGDFTSTYVAHDGTVYEIIQFYTGEPADQESYKQTTDQMLSTVKFN